MKDDILKPGEIHFYPEVIVPTKREQFAMAAMQGLLSKGMTVKELESLPDSDNELSLAQIFAKTSVAYADALIAELEKK